MKKGRYKKSDAMSAGFFLAPAIVGYTLFILIPIIMVLIMGFTKFNLISGGTFVGLANFKRFIADVEIKQAFGNTLKFVLILVPLHLVMGLVLAYGVYRIKCSKLRSVFRGVIYFPSIVTAASVAIVFSTMFSTNSGFINYYLNKWMGITVPWLTQTTWAYVTIAIFSFWKTIGTTFLYYFIGLNNIPEGYYEAAEIDGASEWQKFKNITIPLLSPTTFFVLITTFIGVFQIFDEPYFITNGGPGTSTMSVGLKIYRVAFGDMNFGYGSVIASVLFIVIMLVTIVQFIGQKKWVVYDYE